jgi:hypothetical protein
MTGPTDPYYSGPTDPAYSYGQFPSAAPPTPARERVRERLAERLVERPAPRLGISLAGIGVAIAVLGVVIWGLYYVIQGVQSSPTSSSDSRQFLGFTLALVVVVVGYVLVVRVERGPLATAGIAASALGIPVAVDFLTLDATGGSFGNPDAVVWVSLAAYVVSYLFVRGARGHAFYLGLSLLLLWEYVLDKVSPSATSVAASVPGPLRDSLGVGAIGGPSVDWPSIAGVSLTFGIGYYLLAWWLDHTGRRGAAVAFVVVGLPATAVGIGALGPDLKQIGTGIVLVLVSLVLARYGARYDRRFTTWFWTFGAAVGAVLITTKLVHSSGASVGIALIVLGAVFVVGGWLIGRALDEPDDMTSHSPTSMPTPAPVGAAAYGMPPAPPPPGPRY